ncbi:hypothetical protein DFJ73DRAFT_658371 [Zopfochytrium polystomum]|nr:hypothetical protein DFJ73DRAFT_658371 [Zopfochytrium polystomum]
MASSTSPNAPSELASSPSLHFYYRYDAAANAVRAVTVFPTRDVPTTTTGTSAAAGAAAGDLGAEITRVVAVRLRAGLNTVAVEHLPSCIDADSVRVDGGRGPAVVLDVTCTPALYRQSATKEISSSLRSLEKKRLAKGKEQSALRRQLEILDDYSKTISQRDSTDPATLDSFLDTFLSRKLSINAALEAVDSEIAGLDKQIEDESEKLFKNEEAAVLTNPISKTRGTTVTIELRTDEDTDAELMLSYGVSSARWTPLYEVRAHVAGNPEADAVIDGIDKHRVVVRYHAAVSQSTGESWDAVALTLAAAAPQRTIPFLRPVTIVEDARLGYFNAAPSAKKASVGGLSVGGLVRSTPAAAEPESERSMLFRRPSGGASQDGVYSAFAIEGLATIPSEANSDSNPHKVSIAELTFETVDMEWISVPKEQAIVFLQCKVHNTSEYPLLPGKASVFLENCFVAKSSLPHVAPHETFSTSLGPDSAVRIAYSPLTKKRMPAGSSSSSSSTSATAAAAAAAAAANSTTFFSQRIAVLNARRAPLHRLLVRDQVPVSHDPRIRVAILAPKDMPVGPESYRGVSVRDGVRARFAQKSDEDPVDGEKTDGSLEWVCRAVPAGASFDLNLLWEVCAPAGLHWMNQ